MEKDAKIELISEIKKMAKKKMNLLKEIKQKYFQ